MDLSESKIIGFLDDLYLQDGSMYKFQRFPSKEFLQNQIDLIKTYMENNLFIKKSIITFTPTRTNSYFLDFTISISWIDTNNQIRQIVEPIYW